MLLPNFFSEVKKGFKTNALSSWIVTLGWILVVTPTAGYGIVGLESLEKRLIETNQSILSLQSQIYSKEQLLKSASSGFYPSLNIIAGYSHNYDGSGTSISSESSTNKGYLGYFEGKFNIYKGFKDFSFRSRLELEYQLSQVDLEARKRDLRLELIEITGEMILLHKFQAILDEEAKVTQAQKQMASKKSNAGLTGKVDIFEISLRESEIEIEQVQINQKHLEAHQRLLHLFGDSISDTDLGHLDFSRLEPLLENSVSNYDLNKTLEAERSNLLELIAKAEKKEAKADFFPVVDFTYGFGRITPDENRNGVFNESQFGVLITIPLFSGWETWHKVKSLELVSQSVQKERQQKLYDIKSNFSMLLSKQNELKTLYEINEKKIAHSTKYFDLTLSEYRRGIKNSPDLVGATERWFASKKKKYELLKELEVTNAKLVHLYAPYN